MDRAWLKWELGFLLKLLLLDRHFFSPKSNIAKHKKWKYSKYFTRSAKYFSLSMHFFSSHRTSNMSFWWNSIGINGFGGNGFDLFPLLPKVKDSFHFYFSLNFDADSDSWKLIMRRCQTGMCFALCTGDPNHFFDFVSKDGCFFVSEEI